MPAISEEFLFRMFAIPFLRKLVRWMPLALVLAGFIWGFGHAGYPQQPFYIRGVEVGIGGVALGLIMLRWGILPTLVWHYSVDAMYSAMLLLRSHSLYFRLSGAASAGIIVLPVIDRAGGLLAARRTSSRDRVCITATNRGRWNRRGAGAALMRPPTRGPRYQALATRCAPGRLRQSWRPACSPYS